MCQDDLLGQFKKFGLLYWCVGYKMWRRYGKYNSGKLAKIPLILEKCTVKDRYALLEVAATVFLNNDYEGGDVSDKLCMAICDNEESLVTDDPELLALSYFSRLETEYKNFVRFREEFSIVGLKSGDGSIMEEMRDLLHDRLPALDYFIDVCAFIALAGHKKLPYLYSTNMSDTQKFFHDALEEMSFQNASALERLWYQFKLYEDTEVSPDRFILPLSLVALPDVVEAVKNKQKLTLEQVKALVDSTENMLPVYNIAQEAMGNNFHDGCHTALPKHWVADYLLNGTVKYQSRSYDAGLFGWLYRNVTVSEEPVIFTGAQCSVFDDDLAL